MFKFVIFSDKMVGFMLPEGYGYVVLTGKSFLFTIEHQNHIQIIILFPASRFRRWLHLYGNVERNQGWTSQEEV